MASIEMAALTADEVQLLELYRQMTPALQQAILSGLSQAVSAPTMQIERDKSPVVNYGTIGCVGQVAHLHLKLGEQHV